VENYILNVKREHPSWCARKIRERLIRRFSGIPIPAKSTIHAVLDRHGLVKRRGRVRRAPVLVLVKEVHARSAATSSRKFSDQSRPTWSLRYSQTAGWSMTPMNF